MGKILFKDVLTVSGQYAETLTSASRRCPSRRRRQMNACGGPVAPSASERRHDMDHTGNGRKWTHHSRVGKGALPAHGVGAHLPAGPLARRSFVHGERGARMAAHSHSWST